MSGTPHWTSAEWADIEHAARQARTYRAYAAAGERAGNHAQRSAMAGSAQAYELKVRRFARLAIRNATR